MKRIKEERNRAYLEKQREQVRSQTKSGICPTLSSTPLPCLALPCLALVFFPCYIELIMNDLTHEQGGGRGGGGGSSARLTHQPVTVSMCTATPSCIRRNAALVCACVCMCVHACVQDLDDGDDAVDDAMIDPANPEQQELQRHEQEQDQEQQKLGNREDGIAAAESVPPEPPAPSSSEQHISTESAPSSPAPPSPGLSMHVDAGDAERKNTPISTSTDSNQQHLADGLSQISLEGT